MHTKNNPAKKQTTKKATRGISSSKQVSINAECMKFLVKICNLRAYTKAFVVATKQGGSFKTFNAA